MNVGRRGGVYSRTAQLARLNRRVRSTVRTIDVELKAEEQMTLHMLGMSLILQRRGLLISWFRSAVVEK